MSKLTIIIGIKKNLRKSPVVIVFLDWLGTVNLIGASDTIGHEGSHIGGLKMGEIGQNRGHPDSH